MSGLDMLIDLKGDPTQEKKKGTYKPGSGQEAGDLDLVSFHNYGK